MVLGSETSAKRFTAAETLLNYGFANYTLIDALAGQALPPVEVLLGAERWVQPVLQGSGKVVVRRSQLDSVTTELRLAENVEAPVEQDQVLGEVTVLVNGQPLASLPLTAQTAVERLTIPGVFRRLLDHLFMAA